VSRARLRSRSLICIPGTSVRIDKATHRELKRLAAELGTTVGDTVALAVRFLRQDRISLNRGLLGLILRIPS